MGQALKAWLSASLGICLLGFATTSDLAGGETPAVSLATSPASLDFGDQAVGSQSQLRTITISNPSTADIRLGNVLLSGIDFSQKTDCGPTLAAGASCAVQVLFKPVISGPRMGNLVITGSDSGSPHFVAVLGTGK
jgi:hypothetical protein